MVQGLCTQCCPAEERLEHCTTTEPWQNTGTKPFLLGTASFLGEDKRDGGDASGQDCQKALEGLRQLR